MGRGPKQLVLPEKSMKNPTGNLENDRRMGHSVLRIENAYVKYVSGYESKLF